MYLNVIGIFSQPGSPAIGAKRFTPEPGKHYTVLYLITFVFKVLEKLVQSFKILGTFPQKGYFLFSKVRIWPVDREIVFAGMFYYLVFPPTHLLPFPTYYCLFVN